MTPQLLRAVFYWYKIVMKYQFILKKIDLAQTPPLMSALVISGHFAVSNQYAQYSRKQTSLSAAAMSALCQKRAFCAAVKNVVVPRKGKPD
jgi:hypothetical protein